jgi:hypothetical protein
MCEVEKVDFLILRFDWDTSRLKQSNEMVKFWLENLKGLSLITIFIFKKCPFLDAQFSPFQGSFGPRLPPLESLNLLLFGYIPYIPTTDQPLAQKLRLKMIMPKCDVFFRFWITKDVKKIQIDAKNLFKLLQIHFLIILLARDIRWSKWRTHLFPLPELDNRLKYLNQTWYNCCEWGVWGPRYLLPARECP